ncbi:Aminotransferase-like, plant mobile domain [Dillenia turbinata]|uniref:Aminotransferase-like, plant mobile domain n=1 Tax=Dillenia turbinata TaxID=194707 RepID=A0AAN8ZBF6_9MAGN
MELYATNPGPLDDSVLYDQDKHVSSAVWAGQERGALRCHEHTSKIDQWTLTAKQIELVEKAGFGYLRFIPAISLDNPLISALVERWRRETNTFHLNVGEMTVTLEDVAYLLGLAIDGDPVIGVTHTTCDAVCEKYLGRVPDSGYTSGGMVKLSWLKEFFSVCPEDAPIEEIERHTRAYLLYLVGSTIFSTTTGNKVPVMYLPLFEDFERCGKYAWGAAALAFLYRALGNASMKSQSTISGSLTLLQCWSYFHLNLGRPKLTQDPLHDFFPLVLRWKGKQSGPTSRDVTFYRKALDTLEPSDVEWVPYTNVDETIIPEEIKDTLIIGRAKTMLICFDKAERHLPDRVLRQYGMPQPIPEDVQRWERKSRGVDGGVDLSLKMELELSEWFERSRNIVELDEVMDESEYMQWYMRITRRYVGRPVPISSEFQRMYAALRDISHLADGISTHGMDNHQIQTVTRIRYIVHECLHDQVGSSLIVSAASENELGNRGRGKENVRRKGMRKRKRKDDHEQRLEPYYVDQTHLSHAANGVDQIELCHIDNEDQHVQPCRSDGELENSMQFDADESNPQICHTTTVADEAQFCLLSTEVDLQQVFITDEGDVPSSHMAMQVLEQSSFQSSEDVPRQHSHVDVKPGPHVSVVPQPLLSKGVAEQHCSADNDGHQPVTPMVVEVSPQSSTEKKDDTAKQHCLASSDGGPQASHTAVEVVPHSSLESKEDIGKQNDFSVAV